MRTLRQVSDPTLGDLGASHGLLDSARDALREENPPVQQGDIELQLGDLDDQIVWIYAQFCG